MAIGTSNQKRWAFISHGGITPCDPPNSESNEIHASQIGSIKVRYTSDHAVLSVEIMANNIICLDHTCLIESRLMFCLCGTAFQHRVWQYLTKIPPGQTISYGKLASAIGHDGAARAVGMALNKNPAPVLLPCHRVIGADGGIGGYSLGQSIKEKLLCVDAMSQRKQKI
jgi:O-6-methylguanine DNA methyltransferase